MSLTGKDRIVVERDGEQIEVFNHVNVSTRHYVNSVNGHETFDPSIGRGDGPATPEAVTKRIADYLWAEWSIDVEDHGIEVIDPQSDGVTML